MRKLPHTPERTTNRRNDPPYAPTVEIFDSMTHPEIHEKVQLMQPAVLTGGQQAWGDAAAGLADAVAQAHTEIRAAIADGWRGSAAQRAAEAVYGFEQTGQDLADVLAVVSQRLGQAGDAAEALRAAVSTPSGKTPDLGAALLDPTQATSNVADQKTTEHTRQDIVRAMNDIYTGVFIPTGTDVPAFLDEQFGAAPATPSAAPVANVTGPGADAGTSVAQPIPLSTSSTATQPVAAPAADAPAEEQVAPERQQDETAPATTIAAVGGAADAGAGSPAAPAAPRVAAAATDTPLSLAPAATRLPTAPAMPAVATPSTTTASAHPVVVPTAPGSAGTNTPDEQRKRDERRGSSGNSGSDAVSGLGAGAMGGLMGGAMVAGDAPRQGSSVAANAATAANARFDEEDEDDFHFDDLPTYLEPSDDNGELIGSIDPTTPPVLGEWTELE
ncbi:WXG100 family type VII secretion target [Nocardia sp. NPDC051052]|uniref:WXG100 family type VII secretion target n=1 Tax=Nocardia sp. NPDC051052 TaxID=3364322 RepID=UPI00378F53D9